MVLFADGLPRMPLLALDAACGMLHALIYAPGRPLPEQAALHLPCADAEAPGFWEGVCLALGRPRPERSLRTAPGSLEPGGAGASFVDLRPLRHALVHGEVREENQGVPLGSPCFWQPVCEGEPPAPGSAAPAWMMDAFCAKVHGAMSLPALQARTMRQGCVLVDMGAERVSAALVFRNRLFGYMAAPAAAMTVPLFLDWLEAFRLGWLPPEKAEAAGGFSFVCIGLPAEAEGFGPLYVMGENAAAMKAHGQLLAQQTEQGSLGCRGLVCGLQDDLIP